ncbi:hypothetical protein HDV00_000706 [Rhizophlyctis rosea]|nr:hypothetical protein HDV00_000706 [Rhizophlyctis rosea]
MIRVPQCILTLPPAFTTTAPSHASAADPSPNEPLIQKAQEWFDKGTELWNQEDIQGALEAFEKSVWTRPTADGYYNMANCHYSLGKHEAAIKAWKQSLELSPDNADAHINIANLTALILKDGPEACKHYEAALNIDPNDGEARYNYGVVLDSMGKLEEAIKQFRGAVKLGVEVAEKTLRNAVAKLAGKEAEKEGEK